MTKLTERSEKYAPLEEYPNTLWRKQGFKSGWLAALEEVGKSVEGTEYKDSPPGWSPKAYNAGRSSLRAEIFKAIEGLKK